jgi:hypothetical protein
MQNNDWFILYELFKLHRLISLVWNVKIKISFILINSICIFPSLTANKQLFFVY